MTAFLLLTERADNNSKAFPHEYTLILLLEAPGIMSKLKFYQVMAASGIQHATKEKAKILKLGQQPGRNCNPLPYNEGR